MALSADGIRQAFDALSAELERVGQRGDMVVVGGAALVMLFGARETTKDVDAYFVSPTPAAMRTAAARVAEELSLPEDWLNDAAKGFLVGLTTGAHLYQSQFLLVRAASTEQLLAMKLAAWRDAIDREDARLLMSGLSGSMEDVWGAVKLLVPPRHLDKAWYAFQDLWEVVHGTF